jgi:hypothetical protein
MKEETIGKFYLPAGTGIKKALPIVRRALKYIEDYIVSELLI